MHFNNVLFFKKVNTKITCVGVTSFISCPALAWFLFRDRMSTSFCSDKTIWFHLIVTGDIFGSFFMSLSLQIHKDAAFPHLDVSFQRQFFILDLTNVIFPAVCWLVLWYDYLYQFRGLKILSQIWLQIVLWKERAILLLEAFTYIYITNFLSSVVVFEKEIQIRLIFLPSNSQQPSSGVPLLPPPACLDWSTQKEVWGRVWLLKGATASGFLWVVLHSLGEVLRHPTVGKYKSDCQQGTAKYLKIASVEAVTSVSACMKASAWTQPFSISAYHVILHRETKRPTQHSLQRSYSFGRKHSVLASWHNKNIFLLHLFFLGGTEAQWTILKGKSRTCMWRHFPFPHPAQSSAFSLFSWEGKSNNMKR